MWDRLYEFDTNRDNQLDDLEFAEFIQDWMQKKAEHTRHEWMATKEENRNVTKDIQQLLDSFGTEGRLKDIGLRDLVEALEKAELRVVLSNEQREKRVEEEEQQKQQKKTEARVETTDNPLHAAAAATVVADEDRRPNAALELQGVDEL